MFEWWQWLVGAVTVLGLSAAPWIAALLAGKLHTSAEVGHIIKAHDLAITTKDAEISRIEARHADTVGRILAERDYERAAKDVERVRADTLAGKLAELADGMGQTAVHLLAALPKPRDPEHGT
jgi:hypothetical protein